MNAKRLIYLSLFLGTTCFNPSHAADPLDTVTDGNVRQLCERYHITEFKKTECLTGYQQVQQERLLCEESSDKSKCIEEYQQSLQRWRDSRKGKATVILPARRSSDSSNTNRRNSSDPSNANRRDSSDSSDPSNANRRDSSDPSNANRRDSSDPSNANRQDSSDLSSVNRQDSSFAATERNYQQAPVLNPNTNYEWEYAKLQHPQEHGIREPQELRKPEGIRQQQELGKLQELRKPQELGQRQSIGGSSELEYSGIQSLR